MATPGRVIGTRPAALHPGIRPLVLNRASRLSLGLTACWAFNRPGVSLDLAGLAAPMTPSATNGGYSVSAGGPALVSISGASAAANTAGSGVWQNTDTMSVMWFGLWGSGTTYYGNDSGANGFGQWDGGGPSPYFVTTGGSYTDLGSLGTTPAQPFTTIQTYDRYGGTNNHKGYLNGVLTKQRTHTANAAVLYSSTSLHIGARGDGSGPAALTAFLMVIWNRVLSADEAAEAGTLPWSLVRPARLMRPALYAIASQPAVVAARWRQPILMVT